MTIVRTGYRYKRSLKRKAPALPSGRIVTAKFPGSAKRRRRAVMVTAPAIVTVARPAGPCPDYRAASHGPASPAARSRSGRRSKRLREKP
jgi:hypothetical protein